jgi:hypothetical protein
LSIEGSYHDVGGFLDRLSSSARVMTSPEVSLAVGRAAREAGVDAAGSIAVVAFDLSVPVDHPGYDPGGRRDPFEAMTPQESSAVPETASSGRRGLAAVPLADVVVRGIARDGLRRLAILETPDRRSFVVRPLDRLADVVVHDVVSSGVVFVGPDGGSGEIQVHKPVQPASGARP